MTRGEAKEEACGHEDAREEKGEGNRAAEKKNAREEAVRKAEGPCKAWRYYGAETSRGPSRFRNTPASESLPHHDPKSEHRG